ncbi:MAG: YicC/YloC family endoribonuclease [Candidatus Brocadiales bacterium]
MLRSMTGFGRAESKDDNTALTVEVRSVNNRFLKITSKLPESFLPYQERLERVLKDRLSRGSIRLDVEYKPIHETPGFYLNLDTLKSYYRSIKELRDELGPEGDVPLASLFSLPGICERAKVQENDVEGLVPVLEKLINLALDDLLSMRTLEGKALEEDIVCSKERIMQFLATLEERAPEVVNAYRSRLRNKLSNLLQDVDIELSEGDLAREVAFFAERSDITEEITRLKSHISQLEDAMSEEGPSGRRQEFIVQEMFREANTMGSKVSDGDMLRGIIEIKMEIEKIKEQVFNVE